MAMDPYSDYQPPAKTSAHDRPPRPLTPEQNGKNDDHPAEDGIIRIDEREELYRSYVRTERDDRPVSGPFGIQPQMNDSVEPEPIAKRGKFGKERSKKRRKRNASEEGDEFLKELSKVRKNENFSRWKNKENFFLIRYFLRSKKNEIIINYHWISSAKLS